MVSIRLNKSNNNPFYGLRNCLKLFQASNQQVNEAMLDAAWFEVKGQKECEEMFFSLLFSIGDITNRQHNIFGKKKVDNGGNANRESFWIVFNWLKNKHFDQFVKFLNAGLFNEYTCFDFLFRSRIKTDKKRKVLAIYDIFADELYRQELVKYVYSIVKGNNIFNKHLVAKFLTLPRLSKRSGHKSMLPQTKSVMENKAKFLIELSKECGWEYEVNGTYANFKGYRDWRKQYNTDLESVLFSTGRIKEFTKDAFLSWFDKLPASARFRVKNKILYSTMGERPKYPNMKEWYAEWEKYKEEKQAEQRKLEEKIRQGQATEEDKIKLQKVKKEAKVTVGATNFNELYKDICNGNIDKLKLESFINKVNLPYNSLVIIDDSGSMSGQPFNFAKFIASVCLVKNPDDDGRNLLGFFNSRSHWHSYIDRTSTSRNSILRTEVAQTKAQPFVNPELSFYDNYLRISKFCDSVFQGGGTYISKIPEDLKKTCDAHPQVLDALKAYPVWTIISDGEWNNLYSPEASMNDFMRKCEQYFGFRPFIVAMDIVPTSGYYSHQNLKADRFSGIDNMIYIPSNPAQIEQFLTNFKDMDVFDVYTPLQSIYRSNRYSLVRENVL